MFNQRFRLSREGGKVKYLNKVRTDYEKIISPFIMKLKTLLLELKNKTTYANINSIEILGGISRIPSI